MKVAFEKYIILNRIYSIIHFKAELNEAELLLRGQVCLSYSGSLCMDFGRNNSPTKAETTHLKIGRNDLGRNDPDETTEGLSDPDSVPVIRETGRFGPESFRP